MSWNWTQILMGLAVAGITILVSLVVFNNVTDLGNFGQPYCDKLSGDASETFASAQEHFCEYNCYYNVSKDTDGKYPPCEDHNYTFNRTAFLDALRSTT